MSRILSLPGLTAAVWVSYLGFVGLLAALLMGLAYHPHFLPVTTMLVLVIVSGPAIILVASWPIIRGPARRRALTCLLIGAALVSGRRLARHRGAESRRPPIWASARTGIRPKPLSGRPPRLRSDAGSRSRRILAPGALVLAAGTERHALPGRRAGLSLKTRTEVG